MDGIRATPMQYPLLGLLADRLKRAQQFAVAPGGYANPPAEVLLNLLGVPAIQQTMERMAYGEPLTTGRGMTARVRPEVAEAAMTLLPAAAGTSRVAERGAMAAGRAGERMAERMVPQIMERGGMPAGLLEGMSSRTVSPLTVYHGSPAKFERFDPTKIGSGEGAQAYGYGHYVAQSQGVAKQYSKANQGRNAAAEGLIDELPKRMQMEVFKVMQMPDGNFKEVAKQDLIKKYPESASVLGSKQGNFYEIDLPDEQIARMLDFDKPLMQQSKEIQALAKQYGLTDPDHLGGDLIAAMDAKRPAGAELMRQAGVPGIRYLDQGSRGTGEGTSNFVVFPGGEDLLTILRRNGGLLGP